MLDIKVTRAENDFFIYIPMGIFLGLIFFLEVFMTLHENFVPISPLDSQQIYTNWILNLDTISNIEVLGQLIYTYYFFYFLIAGIILLVAMVGAIVLTLNFKQKAKHQFVFKQILREKKNSIYFIK